MLEISRRTARTWSLFGARGTFGQTIAELAADNHFYVASADLCESSGLAKFRNEHPDRMINVGIAEQNLIGVASGMASDGTPVFATSFAPFITERCLDQIRMNLGYMQANVRLIGLCSGYEQGAAGNSHYGLEDGAVISCIPGIAVVTPADAGEIVKVVKESLTYKGPMYIRLTGGKNVPIVYTDEYDFKIGKSVTLREGSDVVFFANGVMVDACLRAAKKLAEQGTEAAVVNVHTLKPLDKEAVLKYCSAVPLAVSAEEHSIRGGLGTAVAEVIADNGCNTRLLRLGAPDEYTKTGSMKYMLEKSGLTPDLITERVMAALGK